MPATPTPGSLRKRTLTLAQAADQWENAKRETDRQKALIDEASQVLLAHFEKTGRATYKDRIVFTRGSQLRLDSDKVKAFLGQRLGEFQKRIPTRSLSLLK